MSDTSTAPTDPRQELRRRWLAHAAAAFDLMFHPEHQADLVTFDQREARAGELGRDLTAWLIQQHANADDRARPSEDQHTWLSQVMRGHYAYFGQSSIFPPVERVPSPGA